MINIDSLKTSVQVFSETYLSLREARKKSDQVLSVKSLWAETMIQLLKIDLNIIGTMSEKKPLLLVGNHISYLDIALLVKANPDFSFVAKKEIASWPVFGNAAIAAQTIFVHRENGGSRAAARQAIGEALNNHQRVVIFPSGTTCMNETTPWKKGAFEIAFENNILIQPFRISYFPLRPAAYIGKDFFPVHLYQLARHKVVYAEIEFHPPVPVVDPIIDCAYWSQWSQRSPGAQRKYEKNH